MAPFRALTLFGKAKLKEPTKPSFIYKGYQIVYIGI
jgi:hypothetical protein